MVGDTIVVNGEEFEVIWSGGEGLIPDRTTKSTGIWTPPKRIYNKKSEYWLKPKLGRGAVDKPGLEVEDGREPEGEGVEAEAVVLRDGEESLHVDYLGGSDDEE